MVRKLEADAIATDLAAVRKLLSRRTAQADPIGFAQFQSRVRQLEDELAALRQGPRNRAGLAVFFAGEPVQGSRGVKADFAGHAVNLLQELIAKQFANLESGAMAGTGPVPFRGSSDMLLTDVARGSVGLILEEADRNESLTETELSVAVRKVSEDIEQTSLVDATAFEELLADIDNRYFASLGALFRLLDDCHATVRLVEDEREFELDAAAVHRARERTDSAIMDDDEVQMTGHLFLLPTARRFELAVQGEIDSIHGGVSREFARQHLEEAATASDVVNRAWVVRLKARTITRPNRLPQTRYTLLGLVRPAQV